MPSKKRKLLHPPIQLSLFDFDPVSTLATPSSPPHIAPRPEKKRLVQAGQHIISYWLRRSKRRSIGFLIEEDGLRVTAPRWVSITEIEDAVRSKQRWILKKLEEQRKYLAEKKPSEPWRHGVPIPYLGEPYTLQVCYDNPRKNEPLLDEAVKALHVCLQAEYADESLKTAVERWLQQQAKLFFANRLTYFAKKIGVSYRSFALSSATTQWGSCTADGAIRLNWRLIHLPMGLIDYVVAHELSHLREMNHSPRFWATVKAALPSYEHAKKQMRNYSPCALSASR